LTNDILKCQLKPVIRSGYAQPLTDTQVARLKGIFPEGVCDYSRRGVEQRGLKDTWLAYPRPGHSRRLESRAEWRGEHGQW
jgi:hypothetical protein